MITVLIADDHPVVREGLKQILADTPDIRVAAEATNGREVLDHVRRAKCDVILLDLSMPGRGGLDTLHELKRERPHLPVLVLSMYAEDQFAVRVLKAGAAGYMTKETAPDELVNAIRKVHGGGRYVSPTLAERLVVDLGSPADLPPHELLSDREFQVLCLLGQGKTIKQIGQELYLSEKTVSTYRARLLEKLQLSTTAELVRYAIRNGLVE